MADLSNYLKQQYASALESELAGLENAYKQATTTKSSGGSGGAGTWGKLLGV